MNLITLVVGAGLAVAAMGAPAQEEHADAVRKLFGQAMRPTHTLPAVEKMLGGHPTPEGAAKGATMFGRRISPKQLRDVLGDPTSIDRASGEHWIYKLDDGAVIRVSMYGPNGPIYQVTTLDPETKEAKRWIYFAGC